VRTKETSILHRNSAKETESIFRAVAADAPVMIWMSGLDKGCTWFNKSWLNFVGRLMEAEVGKGWVENVHPEDVKYCLEVYNQSFDARRPFSMEYRLRRHDGKFRWVVDHGAPLHDADSNFKGYIGTCFDITEQVEALERLREKEERHALVLEGSNAAIWDWDVPAKKVHFSSRWKELRGYSDDEITDDERVWADSIHPDDKRRVMSAIEAHFQGNTPFFKEEYRVQHKSGKWIWILDRGVALKDEQGRVVRMAGAETDITERKEAEDKLKASEHRYRAIVESQTEMICRFKLDGTILFANGAYARSVGTEPDQMSGHNFWDFVIEQDKPRVRAILENITPENPEVQVENRFSTVEGDRWFLWTNRGLAFDVNRKLVEAQATGIDITERKRAEEALEFQKYALDQASIVAITDVRGTITYVNDKFCQISGYSREELLGNNHRIINSGYHPKEFFTNMYRQISAGNVWRAEIKNRRKDGTYYWVDTVIVPSMGPEGKPERYVAIRTDITERKETEQALEFQKYALDQSSIVAITDVRGTITYVNDKFCQISGYSREELLGNNHRIINSGYHPKEFFTNMYRQISAGNVLRAEIKNRRKDGTYYWVDTVIVPSLGHEGKPERYVAIRTDITERKETEEALEFQKYALDQSSIVAITDVKGTITYVNDKFCQISGYSREELLGNNHRIINSGYHPKEFFTNMYRQISKGKVWRAEIKNRRKDGSYYWVDTVIVPSLGNEGRPERYVAIRTDITERKEAEEALKISQTELRRTQADLLRHSTNLEQLVTERTAKLQDTVAELEAFSYSIAHDMRAPLRSMTGFCNLLVEDYNERLDDIGRDYIRRIHTAASRMDRLIVDVLNYSKVVREEASLHPVDAQKLIHEIINSYPVFKETGAKVDVQGEFPQVLGNEAMLTQVFSNLLGNAVKFVARGVTPHVKVWTESASDQKVRIYIQDNGIGIPADQHERIFGIFQRVEKSYEGTGIGLAIVQKAANRMGGSVGLKSEQGLGSTFWVELKTPPTS
jgi:PAS domain S-box-containing protein